MIVFSHQPFKIKQTDCNLPDKKKSKYSVRRNPSRPLLLVLTFFFNLTASFWFILRQREKPCLQSTCVSCEFTTFLKSDHFFYPQNPDDFGDLSFRLLKPFNFMNMFLSYYMLSLEGALFNLKNKPQETGNI